MLVDLVYLQPFQRNSLLKCVSQPAISKNSLNPLYFWGSRPFEVINVDIPKKLVARLVMISSMSVPICNHFHVRRANNGRITPF